MSEIIGDTQHLHQNILSFSAVHSVTGSSVSGHFSLASCRSLAALIGPRASAKILSDTVVCTVHGPASASKATTATVAVVPSGLTNWPSTPAQILSIGGAAQTSQSLYVPPSGASLVFAPEASHQLKPAPLVGELPEVVYHVQIEGGTQTDVAIVRVSGQLQVDGVGFVATW